MPTCHFWQLSEDWDTHSANPIIICQKILPWADGHNKIWVNYNISLPSGYVKIAIENDHL